MWVRLHQCKQSAGLLNACFQQHGLSSGISLNIRITKFPQLLAGGRRGIDDNKAGTRLKEMLGGHLTNPAVSADNVMPFQPR